jgi:hypothetical protein
MSNAIRPPADTMPAVMFLPEWTSDDDARVELTVADPAGPGSGLALVWMQRFQDTAGMCEFWDFVRELEDAWPFMARLAQRDGSAALTDMLRRLGAPLPTA